jgi:ferredoxin
MFPLQVLTRRQYSYCLYQQQQQKKQRILQRCPHFITTFSELSKLYSIEKTSKSISTNTDRMNDEQRQQQQQLQQQQQQQQQQNPQAEVSEVSEVTVNFETMNQIQPISITKGEILRTALMKRGISPHNGKSRLINCRGLGTCGTCAVEVTPNDNMNDTSMSTSTITSASASARSCIEPIERTTQEKLRLNFPPHGSMDQSSNLRLACQIQINDDVHVRKKSGFWGQSSIEDDLAEAYDAQSYFGELEFVLDNKSPVDFSTDVDIPNRNEKK